MQFTIKDIAKKADVSIATVSRVMNNIGGYSEETKQKILSIAHEMEYIQNKSAVSLVSKKSNLLGIIMPQYTTTFFSDIVSGIEEEAYRRGYNVILTHAGIEGSRISESIILMKERNVDGFIILSVDLTSDEIHLIKDNNIPCVLLSTDTEDGDIPYIKVDDKQAILDATSYLIKCGKCRLALIGVSQTDRIAGKARIEGFKESLLQNGLVFSEKDIYFGSYSFESGKESMEKIINDNIFYDGIVCASDETAMGVISACSNANIRIPEELSIIGYDNSIVAKMSTPPLTTVSQPFHEMGIGATEMLIQILKKEKRIRPKIVKHDIIIRNSVK